MKRHALEVVDLHLAWNFPNARSPDHLDGSVLVFEEQEYVEAVDYRGHKHGYFGVTGYDAKPKELNDEGEEVAEAAGPGAGAKLGQAYRKCAVTHSGDLMGAISGRHEIRVKLNDEGEEVAE